MGTENPEPAEPSLLADAMLGGLARWLRVLGLDVAYDPRLEDAALVDRAVSEGRLILTRDRKLIERRAARHHLLIRSDRVERQVIQVVEALQIAVRRERLFTRCLRCNARLDDLPAAAAATRVPPYVARTAQRFRECPSCGRVYWPATHVARMRERLRRMGLVGDPSAPPSVRERQEPGSI